MDHISIESLKNSFQMLFKGEKPAVPRVKEDLCICMGITFSEEMALSVLRWVR